MSGLQEETNSAPRRSPGRGLAENYKRSPLNRVATLFQKRAVVPFRNTVRFGFRAGHVVPISVVNFTMRAARREVSIEKIDAKGYNGAELSH